MKVTIDSPANTRMILCVGDNGDILQVLKPDGSVAGEKQDSDASKRQLTPVNGFQGLGGSEGDAYRPQLVSSGDGGSKAVTTTCYWVKLPSNGWVEICW